MDQDLSNIYSQSVQGRLVPMARLSSPFSGSPQIERDSALINLEASVFSKINELTKQYDVPSVPKVKSSTLRTISFEEALKELAELEQANKTI